MPRDIPVGNGNILISFDSGYLLREFYFPHVGLENHAKNEPFRFGVWVNGEFSWIPEGWKISKNYLDDSLVTNVELINDDLKLKITSNDLVDFRDNIYVRKIAVENLAGAQKDVRIFFCHDFHILGNEIGDTAAFRPENKSLLHYKSERYFLINVFANNKFGVDDYATGNKEGHSGLEGTWKDAEDGLLSQNPIAQGSVDSVLSVRLRIKSGEKEECCYWICAGHNWPEVSALNSEVTKKGPEVILKRTFDYWKAWIDKEGLNYGLLPEKISRLYKKSLLIARSQIDNSGSIIAGNDSDSAYFNRDTYSYMWPRDGALAAYAFDLAGYPEISCRFFNLCAKIIEKEGYLLHKYTPLGSMASSWHPWLKDDAGQLPIQEDETALVIWALWKHFSLFRDIEFIRALYKPLIRNSGDFLMNYRDLKTYLPLPSYDLWEEKQGIFTFTASTVYGGLVAAANFAALFGESEPAREYLEGAKQLRQGMDKYLYLKNEKRFARMINFKKNGQIEVDSGLDASLFGIFAFGAYAADDEKVKSTMSQVYERLWNKGASGGLFRYENDPYYRRSDNLSPNPWFITTIWLAQYSIASAKSREELDKSLIFMDWVCKHALESGVLAEQVDPQTDGQISVSPLTWSHTAFIAATQEYLNKLIEIEKCPACNQAKFSKREPAYVFNALNAPNNY